MRLSSLNEQLEMINRMGDYRNESDPDNEGE